MTKKFTVLALIIALFCIVNEATAAPKILRFAGMSPPDSEQTKTMKAMAQEINELTNGSIEIKIYPANQLGSYTLVCEEMMRGTVDMLLGGIASEFDPRLELVNVNGYASTYDDIRKIFQPDTWIMDKMEELSLAMGIRFLGVYIAGFNGVASVRELNEPLNPAVDKGVLCRTVTMDCYSLAAQAMGFRIISLPFPDVYQSMQTGVCDAAVGFSATDAYYILSDVIKHWYATNYAVECSGIMISEKTWQNCTPEEQKVIADVAHKYTMISIDNAEKNDAKYTALLEAKGVKVHRYTSDELQPIAAACQTTWAQLGERGLGKDLVAEFTEFVNSMK